MKKLNYLVKVTELPTGVEVDFDISGTDGVPVSLELIFRTGGIFSGVSPIPNKKDAYLFPSSKGSYTVGNDQITFSPGMILHKGVQLRGALPAMESPTVYLTGITPFKHKITLS